MDAISPYLGLVRLPHPDPPPIAAGKAAAIEAENARIPQRARAAGFPQPAAFPFPRPLFGQPLTTSFRPRATL